MLNYAEGKHRLKFDTERSDFKTLVLQELANSSTKIGGVALDDLALTHELPGIEENVERYRQVLFSLFRKKAFQDIYRPFGAELIDRYFGGVGLIQKTPTVRIQLPQAKSTSYHSDGWYGHGETVRSFWMPLTDVSDGNTLYTATDMAASLQCLEQIQSSQATLGEINRIARNICEPFEGGYGDLLTFSSAMIHGANKNTHTRSRVSFDFRIATSPNDIGSKPLSNFYTRDQLNAEVEQFSSQERGVQKIKSSAITYSNLCGGVSAKAQLMLCSAYAEASNVPIIGNESEIVTLGYMPVLRHYVSAANKQVNTVVVFGMQIFEGDKKLALDIFTIALEARVKIIFCAEGLVLSEEADVHSLLVSV